VKRAIQVKLGVCFSSLIVSILMKISYCAKIRIVALFPERFPFPWTFRLTRHRSSVTVYCAILVDTVIYSNQRYPPAVNERVIIAILPRSSVMEMYSVQLASRKGSNASTDQKMLAGFQKHQLLARENQKFQIRVY
jgi:hypothetical protein